MALHIHHHHLPLPGGDEGTLQTQGKWLACLAIPCWLCFPSAPQGAISKSSPLLGPQNRHRANAGPWPTLCWEVLQALGIPACFQRLDLKSSSAACPWGCFLMRLLPLCCKGARLLHQLLLSKCWPWGPRLFFCLALAIFTCSPVPQLSLQPQRLILGCFRLKGLCSCGPDGALWRLNRGS